MSVPNTPEGHPFGTPASFCNTMTRSFDNRIPPDVRAIIAEECILPLGLGPRVLDLGCGPGLWLREVASLRSDVTVVGYDRDADMLTSAASLGIAQAEWVRADMSGKDFTLPPASADVIAMHFFFHFFDDPRHLLGTVRKALKPGGLMLTRLSGHLIIGQELLNRRCPDATHPSGLPAGVQDGSSPTGPKW